ncbi:MAG TPA: hypothetical protein VII56_19355 [Rhizomicrobium sp.]
MSDDAERHYELAVALSRDVLKGILLINGGAASALIALTDKTSKDYSLAVLWFGCGAIAAIVSTAFGYFSQLYYANHRLNVGQGDSGTRSHQFHQLYQALAILSVIASLALSVLGMMVAVNVARGH